MGNIDKCTSHVRDDTYGKVCVACQSGYGIGGKCTENGCTKCVKCGLNCRSCRFCICTDCESGKINQYDPNNCRREGGVNYVTDIIGFEDFMCGSSLIRFNFFLILIILLLLRKH